MSLCFTFLSSFPRSISNFKQIFKYAQKTYFYKNFRISTQFFILNFQLAYTNSIVYLAIFFYFLKARNGYFINILFIYWIFVKNYPFLACLIPLSFNPFYCSTISQRMERCDISNSSNIFLKFSLQSGRKFYSFRVLRKENVKIKVLHMFT